jgi:hypothetical protein
LPGASSFLAGFSSFGVLALLKHLCLSLNLNIRDEELEKIVKSRDMPVHDARFFERGETEGKCENTE